METGYLNAPGWHPRDIEARASRCLDRKSPAFTRGRIGAFMIIVFLFVLALAIVLFTVLGGRNRRRKHQNAEPVINVTNEPHVGRAPGED
jgi:hypothetical protein